MSSSSNNQNDNSTNNPSSISNLKHYSSPHSDCSNCPYREALQRQIDTLAKVVDKNDEVCFRRTSEVRKESIKGDDELNNDLKISIDAVTTKVDNIVYGVAGVAVLTILGILIDKF